MQEEPKYGWAPPAQPNELDFENIPQRGVSAEEYANRLQAADSSLQVRISFSIRVLYIYISFNINARSTLNRAAEECALIVYRPPTDSSL